VPLHIGIVACSAEGAALCYRTICVEGAALLGPYSHPEVSMHGHNFADYLKFINANDWAGVAELMLSSADKLARAGADFLIAPVNTVHQAFDLVEHRSPRPWLHIAIEVAKEGNRHGYKRVGVLGTRALMEGPVYREKLKAAGLSTAFLVRSSANASIASSSTNWSRASFCHARKPISLKWSAH